MTIESALQTKDYGKAITEFIQYFPKVNTVFLIPVDDRYLTIQLPLTDGIDGQKSIESNLSRADYILKEPSTGKVLRHGFFQFSNEHVVAYSYQHELLMLQLENGIQVRFIGQK